MKKFILSFLQIFTLMLGIALMCCVLLFTVVYTIVLQSLWIILAGLALASLINMAIKTALDWLDTEIICAEVK